MPSSDLDAVLTAADPQPDDLSDELRADLLAMVAATRARATRRRRRRLWIPAVSIGAIVLVGGTGAAVATDWFQSMRVHLEIGGEVIDKTVEADVVIPISYTTEDGAAHSCTYALAYVWGEADALRDFVASHDWTDLGQRAYDYHVAHPWYPSSVTSIDEDGTRHELTAEEIRAEGPVFSHAIDTVFAQELPADLRDDEYVSQGSTDCDGSEQ